MLGDVALGRLAKGERRRRRGGARGALRLAVVDRVDALVQERPGVARLLARLLQTVDVRRPQTEPPLATAALEAQQPRLVVGVLNLQIQTVAVMVAAGFLLPLDLLRREHVVRLRPNLVRSDPRIGNRNATEDVGCQRTTVKSVSRIYPKESRTYAEHGGRYRTWPSQCRNPLVSTPAHR